MINPLTLPCSTWGSRIEALARQLVPLIALAILTYQLSADLWAWCRASHSILVRLFHLYAFIASAASEAISFIDRLLAPSSPSAPASLEVAPHLQALPSGLATQQPQAHQPRRSPRKRQRATQARTA